MCAIINLFLSLHIALAIKIAGADDCRIDRHFTFLREIDFVDKRNNSSLQYKIRIINKKYWNHISSCKQRRRVQRTDYFHVCCAVKKEMNDWLSFPLHLCGGVVVVAVPFGILFRPDGPLEKKKKKVLVVAWPGLSHFRRKNNNNNNNGFEGIIR